MNFDCGKYIHLSVKYVMEIDIGYICRFIHKYRDDKSKRYIINEVDRLMRNKAGVIVMPILQYRGKSLDEIQEEEKGYLQYFIVESKSVNKMYPGLVTYVREYLNLVKV